MNARRTAAERGQSEILHELANQLALLLHAVEFVGPGKGSAADFAQLTDAAHAAARLVQELQGSAAPRPAHTPVARAAADVRDGAVLLVDDSATMRHMLTTALESQGFTALGCGDGEEALRKLRERADVGVLVTDVHMPGVSGIALAHEARRLRPELPIVFVTGSGDPAEVTRAGIGGSVGLVRKPFRAEELVTAVADALARAAGTERSPI